MTALTPARAGFVDLYAADDDPWRFRTSDYEARKRALTLACLPAPRYRRGYEPGCANGELTAALAGRCDRLVASDGVPAAAALAPERVAHLPHVDIVDAWVPEGWPAGAFDLVVLSEIGYFLTPAELCAVIDRIRAASTAGGTVLACHWRHPIDGHPLDARAVHRLLGAGLGMRRVVHHLERDFLIDVWVCATPG